MLKYIYLVIKMKHHLNHSKEDPKYILNRKNKKLETIQTSTWKNRRLFQIMQIRTRIKKLHKYASESAKKITIITVFLAGLLTTLGYNTKIALQKLSET